MNVIRDRHPLGPGHNDPGHLILPMSSTSSRHKKVDPIQIDRDPTSQILRQARDLIQTRKFSVAFSLLDNLLASSITSARRWQIRVLLAEAELRQQNPEAAQELVATADENLKQLGREWLSVLIMQVRATLGSVGSKEAENRALEGVEIASAIAQKYYSQSAQFPIATQGVVIAERPHKPVSVAVRLGSYFIEAGELDAADALLTKAEELGGAQSFGVLSGRARLNLALGNFASAVNLATQAIQVDKFHAKSLGALGILIAARRATGMSGLDLEFWGGVQQAPSNVANRFVQLAITHLKRFGDPLWLDLTRAWLTSDAASSDSITRAELEKGLLSYFRRVPTPPTERIDMAGALENCPKRTLRELIFAIGDHAIALASTGQVPKVEDWDRQVNAEFGPLSAAIFRRSLASRLLRAGLTLQGEELLTKNLTPVEGGESVNLRSMWKLARIKEDKGDLATAANLYGQIYDGIVAGPHLRSAQAFCIRSILAWLNCTTLDDPATSVMQIKRISGLMESAYDYSTLLQIARALVGAPAGTKEIAVRALNEGCAQAQALVTNANASTAQICTALFRAGRVLRDYGYNATLAALWTNLAEATQSRLWNGNADFWAFLGDVITALRKIGKLDTAQALAEETLSDPTVSPEGTATIGTLQALWLLRADLAGEAFELFKRIVVVAPQHLMTSRSYYWLSLQAWNAGNDAQAKASALRIASCLPLQPRLVWQKSIQIRAIYLAAGCDHSAAAGILTSDQLAKLPQEVAQMNSDLQYVP